MLLPSDFEKASLVNGSSFLSMIKLTPMRVYMPSFKVQGAIQYCFNAFNNLMNGHFRSALLEVSAFKNELMQRCRVAACNLLANDGIFVHVREQQPQLQNNRARGN